MRERIFSEDNFPMLYVYPFLSADATEKDMASSGRVEALNASLGWRKGSDWRVRINIAQPPEGWTREQTETIFAAVNRCWQWIDEQKAAALTGAGEEGKGDA